MLFDLEAEFGEEVARTAEAQFRSPSDISIAAALGHYYGYATGRSLPGRVAYAYIDIGQPDAAERLAQLRDGKEVDVFCVNDNEPFAVDPAARDDLIRTFLEWFFPIPSPYEK